MRLEHGHVITLTHLDSRVFVTCACGAGSTVMESEHAGEWIKNHRLDKFYLVRYNLTERGRYNRGGKDAPCPDG